MCSYLNDFTWIGLVVCTYVQRRSGHFYWAHSYRVMSVWRLVGDDSIALDSVDCCASCDSLSILTKVTWCCHLTALVLCTEWSCAYCISLNTYEVIGAPLSCPLTNGGSIGLSYILLIESRHHMNYTTVVLGKILVQTLGHLQLFLVSKYTVYTICIRNSCKWLHV